MADREAPVTLRTRKFIRNQLLSRRQMVVYVILVAHSAAPLVLETSDELMNP
jgi:hypothetical protein